MSSVASRVVTKPRQGVYWCLTLPLAAAGDHFDKRTLESFSPDLVWLKGQCEVGTTTGYHHWQMVCSFSKKKSLRQVKEIFGDQVHAELCRSAAADAYVWKDDTAIVESRFEKGLNLYDFNT